MGETVNFFTDSKASLGAIQATHIKSRTVLEALNTLNSLGSSHKVTLHWVPGHSGIPGNERADELARTGSASKNPVNTPHLPLEMSTITRLVKGSLFKENKLRYSTLSLSSKGKIPLAKFLDRYKYKLMFKSGEHIRWMTWLLTGHSPLAYFQNKCGNFEDPYCEFCNSVPETSEHFLCECTGYSAERMRHLGSGIISMDELIDFPIDSILAFIADTGRLSGSDIFVR